MPLLRLSTELITAIAGSVHPSTIVNFALTCRRVHNSASGSLALHSSRRRELRAQHDRHPMTIINLLRTASTSPDSLWYIKVLEFYGSRSSWKQWKTYYDYERMQNEPKVNLTSIKPDRFSDLDLKTLLQNLGLESFAHDFKKRFWKGDDEPLKAILIASCPSLEKVTWVAHDAEMNQPYSLLCDLISACQTRSLWPPGFLSLRSISLGACIEHVHPHDNLHPEITDFCRLLLLPNLKSLRINVAGYGGSDSSELEYLNTHVPERSSSVEEITINICDFDPPTIVAILKRSRSLKIYREIFLGPWTNILDKIMPFCKDSLEELRPEGSNDEELRLYGKKGISTLSCFPNLRVFVINIGDLISENITKKSLPAIGRGKKVEWHDFHAVLPPAAEDIIIRWPPRMYSEHLKKYKLHKTLFPDFFEQLDGFVQQRGKNNGGRLKYICLEFVQSKEMASAFEGVNNDFQKIVDGWRTSWAEAGVKVTYGEGNGKVEDEVLECHPTAIEQDDEQGTDSDSD